MAAKKYRNAITFTDRNNARIRLRQRYTSFSRVVNEDLSAYYDILDCMSLEMNHFFTVKKWRYYCACLHGVDIYKYTPRLYARIISWALKDGVTGDLDTKYDVNAKALAKEARGLSIAQAIWVYDRVQKNV